MINLSHHFLQEIMGRFEISRGKIYPLGCEFFLLCQDAIVANGRFFLGITKNGIHTGDDWNPGRGSIPNYTDIIYIYIYYITIYIPSK